MDEIRRKQEARKFRRFRNFGDIAPYCRLCGKLDWRFRYEHHHIAGKKYSSIVILLCGDCHDWISDMQKDRPPLPQGVNPQVAELVHQMHGQIEIAKRSIECWERAIRIVTGVMSPADDHGAPANHVNTEEWP